MRRSERRSRRGGRWSSGRGWSGTTAAAAAAVAALFAGGWAVVGPGLLGPASQEDEAVMVVAGEWVLDQLPAGETRLDPHRSGAGKDGARVSRVAQRLGATLGTLDDTRRCTDVLDPSTCRLEADRLLAIGAPRIDGDAAQVKVYAWYRSGSSRQPVAQRSWELQLRRDGGTWRVVSGGAAGL